MSYTHELDIAFETYAKLPLLSHLLECTAPVLRRLSITNESEDQNPEPMLQLKLDAPVFQTFSLFSVSLGRSTGHIVNLTELVLDGVSDPPMTHFPDLLGSNTNLHYIVGFRSDDGDPHQIVHLNSVEALATPQTDTKEVLNHLSLPATAHTTIEYGDRMGTVEQVLPAVSLWLTKRRHRTSSIMNSR
jgi:hypothetical protein